MNLLSEEEKLLKLIDSMGLWEVEKVQVRYISDTWAQFSCEKKVCNGPTEIRNVQYTLLDRIKGISFDEKVESEFHQFIALLNRRNDEIRRLRGKEDRLRSLIRQ